MPQKIKKTSGYPTSDSQTFEKYDDAMKHQAKLDLDKAVDSCEDPTSIQDFIKNNTEVVTDFIKYNCKKTKPAARKPAKKEKPEKA